MSDSVGVVIIAVVAFSKIGYRFYGNIRHIVRHIKKEIGWLRERERYAVYFCCSHGNAQPEPRFIRVLRGLGVT